MNQAIMTNQAIIAHTAHCAYCPTLCLHACPVVTAEGSDVVSPHHKMSLARWVAMGQVAISQEVVAALHACTSCGACTDACRLEVPVADTLRMARVQAAALGVCAHAAADLMPPSFGDNDAILPRGVSGFRLYELGHREAFLAVARARAQAFEQRVELVFASAQDARCVREVYPAEGISVRPPVVLASERPGAAPDQRLDDGPVAYFEACQVARSARADLVLANARAAAGERPFIELRWRGDTATCCGAGGAYGAAPSDGGRRAAERILDTAMERGAQTLLTGCAGCAHHLQANLGDRALAIRTLGL